MAGVWMLSVFVVTACWIQLILGTCTPGKFGESCLYSCHCGDFCNQATGVCVGDCDPGWVGGHGTNCQKDNVAYKRTASSPTRLYTSSWSADKAVDGNRDQDVHRDSCFDAADNTWALWTVDLGKQYRIHDVKIYQPSHHPERIRSCVLFLSNKSSSTGLPCYAFPHDTPVSNGGIYNATCDGNGRYFSISNTTFLSLCEVEIYVCSPGLFGETCNEFCHCAKEPCDHVTGLCPGDCRPGWRGDRCDTECDADHYGVNCVNTCDTRKCSDVNSSCDRYTGSCDSACLPGWRGVDCTQECSSGIYGQNCSDLCSDRKCAGDSDCDHKRGTCLFGCAPGWVGEDCRQACETGRYGATCDKTCASRHCKGCSTCNSTGDCDGGCEAGWTMNDCTGKDEEARFLQVAGCNSGHLAAAVAVSFVVGAVVGAVVCFVFWWRRNRRPTQTSESTLTNASNSRTDQAQSSDGVGPETRTYESLHAESRYDAKMTGGTYCTIKSGNTDSKAQTRTSRNVSESVGAQVYENIDHTPPEVGSAYSKLGKLN